ncbi:hypothetical protein ACFL2V_09410 [Pseudomonadota bacterium]
MRKNSIENHDTADLPREAVQTDRRQVLQVILGTAAALVCAGCKPDLETVEETPFDKLKRYSEIIGKIGDEFNGITHADLMAHGSDYKKLLQNATETVNNLIDALNDCELTVFMIHKKEIHEAANRTYRILSRFQRGDVKTVFTKAKNGAYKERDIYGSRKPLTYLMENLSAFITSARDLARTLISKGVTQNKLVNFHNLEVEEEKRAKEIKRMLFLAEKLKSGDKREKYVKELQSLLIEFKYLPRYDVNTNGQKYYSADGKLRRKTELAIEKMKLDFTQ